MNSKITRRRGLFIGAAFAGFQFLAPQAALAQTVQPAPTPQQPATSADDQGFNDIIVTAQRREQRLTEVPVSVQAIGQQTLARAAFVSGSDIVKLSPSVTFVQGASASSTSIAIRGISSINQEGGVQPSTAVVVDEVPLSRQGEFVSDFSDLDHIEVLRGPQGTLFGKNATAGVINIITNKPTGKFEGSAEAGYTTDGELLFRGVINVPVSDKVRFRGNAYYRDLDGILKNHATVLQDGRYDESGGTRNYGFQGKLDLDLSETINLLLSGDYSHQLSTTGALVILRPDSAPFLGNIQLAAGVVTTDRDHPFINSSYGQEGLSRSYGGSANLTVEVSDALTLKSITAYRNYFNDYTTDADSGPWGAQRGVGLLPNPFGYPFKYVAEPGAGGLPRAPEPSHYFSEELRLNYSSDRLDIVGGGFAQIYRDKKHNSVPLLLDGAVALQNPALFGVNFYNDTLVDAAIKDDVYSLFTDATFKLTDTFSIFGGLRYTHEHLDLNYHRVDYFTPLFDPVTFQPAPGTGTVTAYTQDVTKNNLSGRAGLRYAPSTEHSYYFTFARGYKGPAADISRVSAPVSPARPLGGFLKPEIATSFEVGTKHELLDRRLLVNLAVFHQLTKAIQQSVLIAGGGTTTQLVNAGNVLAYGAELEVSAKVSPVFRIDGGLAYTHAEFRKLLNGPYDGQLANTPYCTAAQSAPNQALCAAQNLSGARANGSPRFAANIAGDYTIKLPESIPFDAFARVAYAYTGSIQYQLDNDPLLREPPHGSLDATLGLVGRNDRWQLLLYGKNLTNEVYYANLSQADNFIGRVFANFPRDIKRYGGVMLKVNF